MDDDNPISKIRRAEETLGQWRLRHALPLDAAGQILREKVAPIDAAALIGQRLKRTPSIVAKLKRWAGMKLSRMQDIGGLRAVVADMERLRQLEAALTGDGFAHRIVHCTDYIREPQDTGYRSLHLIIRFVDAARPECDGLLLELQIRTRLQHAWATAVETVDTFQRLTLKSNQGPEEWLEFFALTAAALALHEGCDAVPPPFGGQDRASIFRKTVDEVRRLRIRERLRVYSSALATIPAVEGSAYYLVELDVEARTTSYRIYTKADVEVATGDYLAAEKRLKESASQVVLVAAESLDALRQAYPNYFVDTHHFVKLLDEIEAAHVRG
jgi:putative GTP pyrophosphokinase